MSTIFIDGSYYIFHKYYALHSWWKLAHKDDPLGVPIENKEFVQAFTNTFHKKLLNLIKTYKIQNATIYVAKDCHQKQIWRQNHIDNYKGTRDYSDFQGGPFFEMVYSQKMFQSIDECHLQGATNPIMIKHSSLEADDCIATMVQYLNQNKPTEKLYILANDHDYMQLINEQTDVYDMRMKPLSVHKHFYGSACKALFMKIVLGDKSDNISKVFNKCGPKKGQYYYDNPEEFRIALDSDPEAKERFTRNQLLIDFTFIPKTLQDELLQQVYKLVLELPKVKN